MRTSEPGRSKPRSVFTLADVRKSVGEGAVIDLDLRLEREQKPAIGYVIS
jgi:hypothetical protein